MGKHSIIFLINNYRQQAIFSNTNRFKSIIFKVLLGISSSDSPHRQEKKTKFGSVISVIFLHTFKVFLLLILPAARKKAIGGPKIGSNQVRNSHKIMLLKCCGCQIDERNITLCSTDFDELRRIGTCILQISHRQILVKLVQAVLRYEFFSYLYTLKKITTQFFQKYIFQNSHSIQQILMNSAGISTCILQMSCSQISSKLAQAVLRYEVFSSFYPPKKL